MIHPVLSSKVFPFLIWTQETFARSKSTVRTKCEICSQLIMKIPEWCHWRSSSAFILKQFLHLVLVLQLLALNRLLFTGKNYIKNTISQNKRAYSPFDFESLKICVAIRIAEDGTTMGAYSFNYILLRTLLSSNGNHITQLMQCKELNSNQDKAIW